MLFQFHITPKILTFCTEISQFLGALQGQGYIREEPKLRRSQRIKTIQGSVAIEGNTLTLDQVTAILDGKKVLGSKKDILEVQNAIQAYERIQEYDPFSEKSFLKAHQFLMRGLIPDAGKFRSQAVGILKGAQVSHVAPPAKRVGVLITELFSTAQKSKDLHPLVVSCLLHYEIEFIHPFSDGNGRMGRLWQQVFLMRYHPVFEYVSVETLIRKSQKQYYEALESSDRKGSSEEFIEYSLMTIQGALKEMMGLIRPKRVLVSDRLERALDYFGKSWFTRKEYLQLHSSISAPTASRDLDAGVKKQLLKREGTQALAKYRFNKR